MRVYHQLTYLLSPAISRNTRAYIIICFRLKANISIIVIVRNSITFPAVGGRVKAGEEIVIKQKNDKNAIDGPLQHLMRCRRRGIAVDRSAWR